MTQFLKKLYNKIFSTKKEPTCGPLTFKVEPEKVVIEHLKPTFQFTGGSKSKASRYNISFNNAYNLQPHLDIKQFASCKEKKKVWIYNISEVDHVISGSSIIRELKVPGVKKGENYAIATSLPLRVVTSICNLDSDQEQYPVFYDGRRVAMDLIDSGNYGLDQNLNIPKTSRLSAGTNFGERGVFWSLHNPPRKSEIAAARSRLTKYYEDVMDRVATLKFTTLNNTRVCCKEAGVTHEIYLAAKKFLKETQ